MYILVVGKRIVEKGHRWNSNTKGGEVYISRVILQEKGVINIYFYYFDLPILLTPSTYFPKLVEDLVRVACFCSQLSYLDQFSFFVGMLVPNGRISTVVGSKVSEEQRYGKERRSRIS